MQSAGLRAHTHENGRRVYTGCLPMRHPPIPATPRCRPRWPRSGAVFCLAWALCCAALPARSEAPETEGPDIAVDASRTGDLIEVRAQATIKAPLSVVWATLTDYERLPEFIPGLKKSRIVARNGATTTVEQSGEARFIFVSIPIEVTLESTERPPNIEVRRVAGSLRHLQGRYETEVMSDPAWVQLRWIGSISPETDLPPLIGNTLVRLSIHQQFAGMVREIERREALRRQTQGR